jgi:hypothetical protein
MLAPTALLALLCLSTLVLFGDRGAVSCNSVNGDASFGIQGDFGLSLSQDGWVYAALMVCGFPWLDHFGSLGIWQCKTLKPC